MEKLEEVVINPEKEVALILKEAELARRTIIALETNGGILPTENQCGNCTKYSKENCKSCEYNQ